MNTNVHYSSEIKEKPDLKLNDRQKLLGTKHFRYRFKIIELTAKKKKKKKKKKKMQDYMTL